VRIKLFIIFKVNLIYHISRSAISYAGGGCALNSVRVFQWLFWRYEKISFSGLTRDG
jgi:hypothetical protein